MHTITYIRRGVQILSLTFLFYGATLLHLKPTEIKWYAMQENSRQATELLYGNPTWTQPFQTFLPARSCRFAGTHGTFRGCLMFFFSDILTWRPPLGVVLPSLALVVVLMVMLARFWCGWICPLGFMSELLYEARKYLGLKRIRFSAPLRNLLKAVGWGLTFIILFSAWFISWSAVAWSIKKPLYLAVCQMCPSKLITPALTGFPIMINLTFPGASTTLLVSLFVVLVASTLLYFSGFILKRAWCKICPLGVILSFFNQGAFLSKEKDLIRCTKCAVCASACPMETSTVYEEKTKKYVNHSQCIHCYRCVDLCPEKKCLTVKFLGLPLFKS
ncbi:4Fe-4S binding protein [candidate division FCPU426 bacterium]|nr:4Fe-4S binding protein [candidate division FCPU426 bacterium]